MAAITKEDLLKRISGLEDQRDGAMRMIEQANGAIAAYRSLLQEIDTPPDGGEEVEAMPMEDFVGAVGAESAEVVPMKSRG